MKITTNILLLALCVFAVRVSTQPIPTSPQESSDFESLIELSEVGENIADDQGGGALPIGATSEPDTNSDSSSSEETNDSTDTPDAEETTPAAMGGLAGAGASGNNDAAEIAAGDTSGAVLGMKARGQGVKAGGFSATAVGVATTLGIVGAIAAAAGIIVYLRKK